MHRSARLSVLLSCAAAVAGCGGSDDDTTSDGGGSAGGGGDVGYTDPPADTTDTEETADDGCGDDAPISVGATNPGYDGWLDLCESEDKLSVLRIKNKSGNTFSVWTKGDARFLVTGGPTGDTFSDYLARRAAPPGDPDRNGIWILQPGATLTASGSIVTLTVRFQLNLEATAAVNAARSAGETVDSLGRPRTPSLVRNGLGCAENAADAIQADNTLSFALSAAGAKRNCQQFVYELDGRTGQAAEETPVWKKLLGYSERLAGGNWDDELAYGVSRFARR